MALILAIEPDRRQASKVAAIVKNRLHAEIVSGDTTEHAVAELGKRVPDLILTSLLLSRKDEAALADWLRQSDEAGAHVQTLVIPVLGGSARDSEEGGGLLSRFTRGRSSDATTGGCDPEVFAAQIREYLEGAAEQRRHAALLLEDQAAAAAAAAAAERLAEQPAVAEPPPPDEGPQPIEMPPWSPAADAAENREPVYFEVEAVVPMDAAPVGAAEQSEADDEDAWSEITLGESDQVAANAGSGAYALTQEDDEPSVELTSEMIDLQRFVEELSNTPVQPAPTRRSKDDVVAEFEEALETITSDATEPARPNGDSQADSEVLTPLVGGTAWPHLDSNVAKTAAGSDQAAAMPDHGAAARPRARKKSRTTAPQDQWSTFDPEQCGFAALLAKLDKMADEGKTEKTGR